MQSKTFSKLSTAIVILASIYVLVLISEKLAPVVPAPLLSENALSTSTPSATTTVPVAVSMATSTETLQMMDIKTPRGTIHAMVASTPDEQERGLSGRDSLPTDAGMLFPFPKPDVYYFWMPDMHFSIDMVWVGTDKRVIGVTGNISPDTYPEVFSPPSPISYVLELNQGDAAKFDIATGTQLVF
jgi:hypothetical protein